MVFGLSGHSVESGRTVSPPAKSVCDSPSTQRHHQTAATQPSTPSLTDGQRIIEKETVATNEQQRPATVTIPSLALGNQGLAIRDGPSVQRSPFKVDVNVTVVPKPKAKKSRKHKDEPKISVAIEP